MSVSINKRTECGMWVPVCRNVHSRIAQYGSRQHVQREATTTKQAMSNRNLTGLKQNGSRSSANGSAWLGDDTCFFGLPDFSLPPTGMLSIGRGLLLLRHLIEDASYLFTSQKINRLWGFECQVFFHLGCVSLLYGPVLFQRISVCQYPSAATILLLIIIIIIITMGTVSA